MHECAAEREQHRDNNMPGELSMFWLLMVPGSALPLPVLTELPSNFPRASTCLDEDRA
jgi:hypothetical protein